MAGGDGQHKYEHLPIEVCTYPALIEYLASIGIRAKYNKLKNIISRKRLALGGTTLRPVFPNFTISVIIREITGTDALTWVTAHKMVKQKAGDPGDVDVRYPNIDWDPDVPLYAAVCNIGPRQSLLRDYASGRSYITFNADEAALWDITWCKRDPKIYKYRTSGPYQPTRPKPMRRNTMQADTKLRHLLVALVSLDRKTLIAEVPGRLFADWNQGLCDHEAPFAAAFSSMEFFTHFSKDEPRSDLFDRYDNMGWFQYGLRLRLVQHTLEPMYDMSKRWP